MQQRTLILLKPDALNRKLMGKILSRYEEKGFKFIGLKLLNVTEEMAKKHYQEHEGKPFFEGLVQFITSFPVLASVLEGEEAIKVLRTMNGATDPKMATPGTIRGDFGLAKRFNLVHASDSVESANREIEIFFNKDELLEYTTDNQKWLEE